jgi:phosphoenolpyruvate-protein kinase (PTS system EI component)
MTTIHGLPIHEGVAYAKAARVDAFPFAPERLNLHGDQTEVLRRALDVVKRQIQADIDRIEEQYHSRNAIVFEAQKLMISDPFLLDRAYRRIKEGQNAYHAYREAADEVLEVFGGLNSAYMRDRAVDIEDVADQVLAAIVEVEQAFELEWTEPHILVVSKLKPSLIAKASRPLVVGLVSGEGTLQQHSARLLQTFQVPSVIVGTDYRKINNNDMIYIDANQGVLLVNPRDEDLPAAFRKEGTVR